MSRVRRTAAARKDYHDIFLYIAEHDIEAAKRLVREFDEKLQLLLEFPGLGQKRDELRHEMRSLPVRDYLIFYRPLPKRGIELIRVVHGARNLKKIFRKR